MDIMGSAHGSCWSRVFPLRGNSQWVILGVLDRSTGSRLWSSIEPSKLKELGDMILALVLVHYPG